MNNLRSFFTTPVSKKNDYRAIFWFSFSIIFTGIYSYIALKDVLSNEYIVHDDVRSHVFWMRRFFDPELFPNDLITDYFQSVAPYGYSALYHFMATLGIEPIAFNKILPLILVLITIPYCFGTCVRIFPIPAAGAIATVFLNQNIWSTHDVASGTPRAFLYPLFLAFLYYLLGRSLFPCLITLLLQGLFYPQCIFVSAGILILRIFRLENWRLRLSQKSNDYLFCFCGLAVSGFMLLPYALEGSSFGPVTTAAEGRNLPILQNRGSKRFFYDNPWDFWVCAERSGMVPSDWCRYFPPASALMALFLPSLLRQSDRFPLTKQISHNINILTQILLSSLGMFFFAHAVLFKLHLPNRYTKHSARILVAIAGAIALIVILDKLWQNCDRRLKNRQKNQLIKIAILIPFTAIVFSYPFILKNFPDTQYFLASDPSLYQFFAKQPKDILIASLSDEANNIPTFSQRSVLVSSETSVPYHIGYYRQIQQRTLDMVQAQYSPNLTEAKQLIEKYGIDFWLIDNGAFTPDYIERNSWRRENPPFSDEAVALLERGNLPALTKVMDKCFVFQSNDRVVLDAKCIVRINSVEMKN
jgi:hypothetical protein